MAEPTIISLWLPRGDEHALAASLGMCVPDATLAHEMIEAARSQVERDMPGTSVRVGRWHVWRVVRAMHRSGAINDSSGRATAFAMLAAGSTDEANPAA